MEVCGQVGTSRTEAESTMTEQSTKVCTDCGQRKPLTEFYLRKKGRDTGYRLGFCRICSSKRCAAYREGHKEAVYKTKREWQIKNRKLLSQRQRELDYLKGRSRPQSVAKDCPLYLGIHIAERVLKNFFDNVKHMPPQNPGYDFVCGRGFKIDAKASCKIHRKKEKITRWQFGIRRNHVADYFLCLAFNDRVSLEPEHVWLIPSRDVSDKTQISITEPTLYKWAKYEKSLDRVAACCEQLRGVV
jgi:hypothetical protein